MGVPDDGGGGSGSGIGIELGAKASASATGRHVPWWRQKRVVVVATCLAAVAVVTLIVTTTFTVGSVAQSDTTGGLSTRTEKQTQKPVDPEFTLPDGRKIIRRSEWSSVPPRYRRPLHHPTPYVVIGHTAGALCRGKVGCFPLLQAYQEEHRSRWDQPDIVYNFLIDVVGNVYEGRGWDTTNNYQSWALRCNLGVTLMGNFMGDNVTQAMILSLQQLLDVGVRLGKLDPGYRLVAHSQLYATLSPGTNVLQVIDEWPHRCLQYCEVNVLCVNEDTN